MRQLPSAVSAGDGQKTAATLFTDETAAQYIGGIEPRTVRDWRMRRGLGFLRITPKVIRIRKDDLDKWLARHAVAITRGMP
jgi:excisionase family DNA binding protein